MTERKGTRHIELRHQDYFHAALTGSSVRLQTTISEKEIAEFCKGCDFLQEDNTCSGSTNDQGRYAIRKGCGWARVDG
ncbi:hypothetical protein ACFL15_00500 [Patescibacteria group bacterium]